MHSKPVIAAKYPNIIATDRIVDLLVLKREVRKVNRKDQMCVIFRHEDFESTKIYCVQRFCVVTKEGPASEFFPETNTVPENTIKSQNDDQEDGIEVSTNLTSIQGILVDDDNDHVEENVPSVPTSNTAVYQEWSGDVVGICN